MKPSVTGPVVGRRHPAADIVTFFKSHAALIDAAVAALDAIAGHLVGLEAALASADVDDVARCGGAFDSAVAAASVGDDNLLVARPGFASDPFVLCTVSRLPSGTIDLRTIELDRDGLALSGVAGRQARSLDALLAALRTVDRQAGMDAVVEAVVAASAQVRGVLSRLSIVKARLALQESFLAAIMDEDVASAPLQLDSHLDHSAARDLALTARRLLSTGSHKIAGTNQRTIASLFDAYRAELR